MQSHKSRAYAALLLTKFFWGSGAVSPFTGLAGCNRFVNAGGALLLADAAAAQSGPAILVRR